MTTTDELRRMLDERGVEWHISNEDGATFWTGQFGIGYYARQNDDGETLRMLGVNLTPEQAIAATLGDVDATGARQDDAGTCRKLPPSGDTVCIVRRHGYEMEFGYWKCSACGCECFEGARYCMGCGRKVRE